MFLLSYVPLVIVVFAISLFYYKKNKKDSDAYIECENADADSEIDEKCCDNVLEEKTNASEVDSYKFEIIYYWITQKVHNIDNIDYDILREKIIQNFQILPEILEDSITFVQKEQSEFLKELLGRADYSSPVKYFLINKGRKVLSWLGAILQIIGFVCFVLYQIENRKTAVENQEENFYLILAAITFLLSFVFSKFSKKILSILIKTLKPGDCIKILSEMDEIIGQEVKINQLSNNETMFNKQTVFFSKKKMICEELVSQSPNYINTINNKLCLYIAIDWLKKTYSKEAYREYLLEKEIDALEFICGFNPGSVSANFELALRYFEAKRFDDFYEMLLKCRNINGYDWLIESYIKSYEFYRANCKLQ